MQARRAKQASIPREKGAPTSRTSRRMCYEPDTNSALDEPLVPVSLDLLENLQGGDANGNFQMRPWDGSTWG